MKKYIKNIITNPLFSGSALMIFGSNFVSFITYLYHLVMGRMLGPSGYGELASLISIIGLLGIIPTSVNLVIIKYVAEDKNTKDRDSLIRWFKSKVLRSTLIFFIIIIILSPFISSFLNISNLSYLFLIAISFLFSTQSMVNRAILQGLLKFKHMILSILMENTTKLFLSIILVYIGFQVGGAMVAYFLATLYGFYITNSYIKLDAKEIQGKNPNIKSMLMFTIPVFVQSISTTSIYSADVILVKHFFSSHDAGIYASLSTLGKIIFFGAGPISAVMFPLISKRKSKGEGFRRVFIYSFVATCFFAAATSLLYFLYPQFAIKLLFGSAYLEASNLLIWFGIFIGFFTLSALLINFSLSLGKTLVVIFPFIAAIAQIILIFLFHSSLFIVILISVLVNALLLLSILIYLAFGRVLIDEKQSANRDKASISNSTVL